LSNRKYFDKTASRIDVGRTGGDSESSWGAAIPEEHVRQPGAAETWTPAETVKRGETVVQEASPGASVRVFAHATLNFLAKRASHNKHLICFSPATEVLFLAPIAI
jgi:hypothetical protein